jgi:DNA repair exonuclease SbcCD ATPase subunit
MEMDKQRPGQPPIESEICSVCGQTDHEPSKSDEEIPRYIDGILEMNEKIKHLEERLEKIEESHKYLQNAIRGLNAAHRRY